MASLDTNKVTGVSTAINATDAIYKEYVDNLSGGSGLPSTTGNSGKFLSVRSGSPSYLQWQSINSTSSSNTDPTYKGYQEFTTAGAQTFYIPPTASQFYIEAIGAGGGGSTPSSTTRSAGGGSGAYNSWLIRRNEFGNATTLTVTPGAGGATASSGGNTTVTWTGTSPTGTATYTLTSNAGTGASGATAGTGGAVASVTLNPVYTTAGLSGASGATVTYPNVTLPGNNSTSQTNAFQPTGGGAGAYNTSTGGNSFTYLYGSLYTSSGGDISGTAGSSGIPGSYTGSYGSGGAGGGALSTGFNSWYLRTSGFGTSAVNTLTYGNGYFVAGGFSATISWTLRTSGAPNTINPGGFNTGGYPITYDGSSLYLYCGSSGMLATSTNAVVWVLRTSGFGTTNIGSVAYGAGRYVACGSAQWITASTDAITWTVRTAGFAAAQYSSMLYVDGKFSILSSNVQPPIFINSTDSIVWTQSATFPNAVTSYSAAFTYATGATNPYVVSPSTSPAQILVSTNTIVWTLRTSGTTQNIYTFAYNGSNLYAGGGSSGYLSTSTDTISWVLRTSGFGTSTIFTLAYNDGIFTAGGAGPTNTTSTDGITWLVRTTHTSSATIYSIYNANNIYIAGGTSGFFAVSTQSTLSSLGNGGLITVSTDSITWTLRTNSNIQSITLSSSSDSYYIASGSNYTSQPVLIASTDNITWITRTTGFGTSTISALGYGNNEFLASVTLPIPVTWTLRTSGFGTTNITTIVYGGTSFIASGVSGTLTSSTNGVSWTLRTSGFGTSNINGATYFNNEYLIGGTLPPQPFWTIRTSGVTSLFRTVTYGNGVYVASGGSVTSMIVSSTDSVTWSLRTSSNNNINVSSTYGSLYLIGSAQTNTETTIISASTDTITWELRTAGHINGTKSLTYQNSLYFNFSSRGTTFNFTDQNSWSTVVDGSTDRYDHDGKEFIRAFGSAFYMSVGDDPEVWILRTTGISTFNITSVACGPNGPYVICGGDLTSGGYIRSSTDSITWFARTSRISDYSSNHAAYYNGIFAVSSQYGTQSGSNALVVTSTNSIVWIVRTAIIPFVYATDILCAANGFWIGVYQQLTYSTDGIVWRVRTVPNIRGNDTNEYRRGVAFGNSVYVNVGGSSSATDLSSSTDSIHWVLRTCPRTYLGYSNNAITFGNNIFVASGSDFGNSTVNIATSTNGIHWFLRTSASSYSDSSNDAKGYGNGIFIKGRDALISKDNTLSVSTDSISWEIRTSGIQSQIQTLVYGNSIYVAGGTGGALITSTDNINWIIRTQPIRHNFETSVYDGTNYIMGGDRGSIVVSTDSIIWSLRTNPLSSFNYNTIIDITYNSTNTLYTASTPSRIAVSTNTIVWNIRTSNQSNVAYFNKNRVLFGNSVYIEASVTGSIATSNATLLNPSTYTPGSGALLRASTDSISWVARTTPAVMSSVNNIGSGGSYSYVSQLDIFSLSTDNINWILRTTGFSGAPLYSEVSAFVYANNIYILGGNGGQIWASTDTIVWSLRTSANLSVSNTINGAVYGDRFVVVDNQPSVRVSTDSIIWTLRTHGTTSANMDIIYNSGVYSLVANSGVNSTSTDTITWILRTTGFGSSSINSISYDNNVYVIGGVNGTLATSTQITLANLGNGGLLRASTDSVSWVTRTTSPNLVSISTIKSGGSYVLASGINLLGQTNALIVSTDNINWVLRTSGLGTSSIDLFAYGVNTYVIASSAQIRTSTDTISWVARTSSPPGTISGILMFGERFLVTDNVGFRASTDAINWVLRTASNPARYSGGSGVYNNGLYVLTSTTSPFGDTITSTDTITWIVRTTGYITGVTTPAGLNPFLYTSAYGNDIYVIGGYPGIIATSTQVLLSSYGSGSFLSSSTDTISWTIRTTAGNDLNINAIGSGAPYTFASTINSLTEYKIIVSTDNIVWQTREAGFGSSSINSFVYGTVYVVAGQGGALRTSTDSIVWTLRTSGFGTSAINSLAYTIAGYVAAGISGSVRTSTDAISWIVRTGGFGNTNINNVTYGSGFYVLSGSSGTVSSASSITQSVAGAGGAGTRGGGGGGGGYSMETNLAGIGGTGGNGYVKITWW